MGRSVNGPDQKQENYFWPKKESYGVYRKFTWSNAIKFPSSRSPQQYICSHFRLHKNAPQFDRWNNSSPPSLPFRNPTSKASTMVIPTSKAPSNLNNVSVKEQQQASMEKAGGHEQTISAYELSREERIRENRERMEKLGIFDLSQKFNAHKSAPKKAYHRKTPKSDSPLLPPSGPVRRSGRLQNSTPVSYCEAHVAKSDKSLNDYDLLREEGSRPEVYTEEHEKLLGSTEMIWTPFVDGYGKDGKRIYDPIKGKTCHQCRQKTLGHRTCCSKCDMVQGQFCGDCLYMRYGENVLEAKANPDWVCPVCRGICNCSLCRQAKGWPPTGALYRKISGLGYKSVAHYLIQTRRATDKLPTSAKRSLPFSDIDEITVGEDDLSKPTSESLNPDPLSTTESDGNKLAPESEIEPVLNLAIVTLSKDQVEHPLKPEPEELGAGCGIEQKIVEEPKTNMELQNGPYINEPKEGSLSETLERGDDNEIKNHITVQKTPISTKKRVRYEPTPDSVAGRLRLRRNKVDAGETETSTNIAPTLERGDDYEIKNHITTQKTPKSSKKRVRYEPTPDSVAGRLRLRRNKANAGETETSPSITVN